jgi:phosphatidyl-myo-inositol dimannoside synthase
MTVPHLLVTNDFPPKLGGIQSYLHELWRRLPPEETTVFTTAHRGSTEWDAAQPFRIVRARSPFLGPTPRLVRRIDDLAREVGAGLVLLDPAWPLGAIGPQLERPYGLILHGAEVTVPARLPFVQLSLRRAMRAASLVIAGGDYPAAEGRFSAGRAIEATLVPPGVDGARFRPLTADERREARVRLRLPGNEVVVLGFSRLVRRKGFDVLIAAAAELAHDVPDLAFTVLIAGDGRDRHRLDGLVQTTGAPVRFVGRVSEGELPSLYGAADVFAMLCRDQWGGLEQEGFGIVFLEAAASGLPALAGKSGGSADAVADGETGLVIDDPRSVADVRDALERLVRDGQLRQRLGAAARERALRMFSYDVLAAHLAEAISTTAALAGDGSVADLGSGAGGAASSAALDLRERPADGADSTAEPVVGGRRLDELVSQSAEASLPRRPVAVEGNGGAR